MLLVPLTPLTGGVFSQRTRLDERDYILRFRHNSRTDSWSLDIDVLGEAGATTPVMTGKKLHIGHDLLRQCFEADRPAGSLYLLHYDGTRDAPTGSTLGRYQLVYLDPGESIG